MILTEMIGYEKEPDVVQFRFEKRTKLSGSVQKLSLELNCEYVHRQKHNTY